MLTTRAWKKPDITIVEPNKADCIFRTAEAGDGRLHNVEGSLSTIMAGLACGEPCMIGWEELDAYADNFMSVPDYVAAKGMRILGNPTGNDGRVISERAGTPHLDVLLRFCRMRVWSIFAEY